MDPFQNHTRGLESPAARHFPITPSDSTDLALRPRALYCLSSGLAVLRDEAGNDISYPLEAGRILPLSAVRVLATGTTASLVGWL